MDGKKKSKVTSDGDHQHRIKRLLQELEKEFDSLIVENQNCKLPYRISLALNRLLILLIPYFIFIYSPPPCVTNNNNVQCKSNLID